MTSLMRREPFGDVQSLRRGRERRVEDSAQRSTGPVASIAPALDMYETENEYVIKLDVAGVDPEEIEIKLIGDSLTIKGEIESGPEDKAYIWRERRSGQFVRMLELPQGADAANVVAEFANGVLMLILPKLEETKPRSIQVKVK